MNGRFYFLLSCLLFFSVSAQAFDHEHDKFAKVLAVVVQEQGASSTVDYAWLKANSSQLDAYLQELEGVSLSTYQSWHQNQQQAFLINAYNAFTLKLILSEYPKIKSIKELGGLFSSPWKIEFFTLLGEIHNLDTIEHQWLRGKFKEPNIHFVLVCASSSCPALAKTPYVATQLQQQLTSAKFNFLGDKNRNYYDAKSNTLYLSKIFSWYAADFEKHADSVPAFVAEGITDNIAEQQQIKQTIVNITYLDYDWSLNQAQ